MRFDQPFLDKGQRDFGGRRVAQLSERYLFCFFEGLEHRTWQPWMPIGELASNADEMHDGKYTCAFEIVLGRRHRVGEQPTDVGRIFRKDGAVAQ